MSSATMIFLFILAPTLAQPFTKPLLQARLPLRSKFPSANFGPVGGYQTQRLSPVHAEFTPEQLEFLRRKRGEVGMTGGLDTHGRPRTGGHAAPAPAYSAPAPASGEYAGFTPDQIEFMKRKKGEVGMTGGLDTHGRPRSGGHAAPAPASSPASGEYAGFTPDQIEFM